MNTLLRSTQISCFFICAAILLSCSSKNPVQEADPRPPDFTLNDIDGQPFTLSSTQGQVVFLHFFAPWCPICQAEAPDIVDLYDQLKASGLLVVGIAVQAGSLEQIRDFKNAYDIPFPILVDDGVVGPIGYRVNSFPTTWIIDRDVKLFGPFGPLPKQEFLDIIQPML